MTKTSKDRIGEDEKSIVRELERNSKESIEKIAKKCGFSRQKVWTIIKRLERDETIWGYHAIVDDEKFDMKRYILLVKRSAKPATDAIKKIVDLTMHVKGEKLGIYIECSSYLHGQYDWAFVFTAKDIRNAKKFSELLLTEYQDIVGEIQLLEDIFSVKKCGIVNPELDRIKDFI